MHKTLNLGFYSLLGLEVEEEMDAIFDHHNYTEKGKRAFDSSPSLAFLNLETEDRRDKRLAHFNHVKEISIIT
ncbi:hypothetical protein SDJN02_06700, partial [Cucurbita argyrosperma subsp. argyrosperma]